MTIALSGMTLHTNNDNEGSWSGTDDADDYNNAVQGANSESWQVSKNSTETGTLTKSSTLPTSRGLFIFWMSSNLAPYYTDIELLLESSNNNDKVFTVANSTNKAIGGNFIASAIDYVNKGTETGTFVPANFSELAITVDNSSSGNIRSVINNWIDAMYYGVGHTVTGTTTTDKLFNEIALIDDGDSNNKYGVVWNYNGGIYSQGDITLNGTALTSIGEIVTFIDNLNGYDTYNLTGTGTVTLLNTSLIVAGSAALDIDTTSMTSFSMTGGAISNDGTTDIGSGQTLKGVVLTDRGLTSIANTAESCTWNVSDTITVTGILNKCTLNESVASTAVSTTSLDKLTKNNFVSDGTGYAVSLGTIASTQAMAWDNTESGYASSDGSTGNETIAVTVNSGITLTINVSSTGSTPTIHKSGTGTVNVVSGAVTLKMVVKDQDNADVENAYAYIDDGNTAPFIMNTQTNSSGEASVSHSDGAVTGSTWRVRKYGYKPFVQTIDIGGLDITIPITLITDPQQK